MRKMKDNGVDWIGEIPKTWSRVKGKYMFSQRNDRGNNICLQLLSPTQRYGVIPQTLYEELSGMVAVKLSEKTDYSQLKTIHKDDYCISLRSFQGGFEYSEYEGVVSPAYQVFYATVPIGHGYYKYLFKENCFIEKMNSYTMSLRDGKNIAFADFGNTYIPVPTLEEQEKIAEYLDAQCAELDALSADIEREISLLEEYKRSTITEAVTKGLDPNVEMKECKYEYLGSIPSHWRIVSLKRVCTKISDGTHFSPNTTDSGFPYITAADVHGRGIDYEQCKYISQKDFEKLVKNGCRPRKNDVLLVKDGATTGRVGLMLDDVPCVLLSSVAMMTPSKRIIPEYLMYLFVSNVLQHQIRESMAGSAMPRITLTKLNSYQIIDCPLEEQMIIVDFLQSKCEQIDLLITQKQVMLENLKSYKKSLIYEYVTGKKEVPQS